MVLVFIKSRINWILWILFLNIILLGVAYIDYEISVESVFYIVILNVGLSILFLLFTFVKEVRLSKHFMKIKKLKKLHKDLAETPFQQQVIDYLYRHIAAQKEKVVEQQLQLKIMNKQLQSLFMI